VSEASDDQSSSTRLEQWISIGATVVAPATLFGALLFYFGYVSSRSQYAYFGVDVDTIGLNTQDYIMRSPQPLLVPLLVLTLTGAGLLTLNAAVRERINSSVARAADKANPGTDPERSVRRIRRSIQGTAVFGVTVLSTGVVLLFIYSYVRDWAYYGLVTPLLIAAGAALAAYARRVMRLLPRSREQPATARDTEVARWPPGPTGSSPLARRTASLLACVVIAASIFWATATIAQWSGRGLAQYDALHFDSLPSVILDTKERLFLHDPGIEETVLPASEGQTFHYRYRGLRLLIEGQNRMFLVPDTWSASDSTMIVPLDGSVRVQFQFQNQLP
jgi:hypothetical protein